MKTQRVIISLWLGVMLGLPLIAPAQTFLPPVGAVWTVNITGFFPGSLLNEVEAVKDTFIMGRTCRKLADRAPMGLLETYTGHSALYWAASGDSILRYEQHDSSFHLLYNFGSSQGDTMEIPVEFNTHGVEAAHAVIIDSVGVIDNWGDRLRRVFWTKRDVDDRNDPWEFADPAMVEGIGSLRFFIPFNIMGHTDFRLVQYREPNLCLTNLQEGHFFFVKPSDFKVEDSCTNIVSTVQQLASELSLYPNPTSGTFNLELPDTWASGPVALSLHDLRGRVVFRQELVYRPGEPLRVEPAGLPAGLYLLWVQPGKGQAVWQKIRVE